MSGRGCNVSLRKMLPLHLVLLLISAQTVLPTNQQYQQPQCACIRNPSGACLQYDSRFQAATLQEAMTSFPDLTLEDDKDGPCETLEDAAACRTQECHSCNVAMNNKMQEVGLLPVLPADNRSARSNITCQKYRFSRKDEGVYDKDDDSREDDERSKRHDINGRTKRQMTSGPILGERFTISCSSKGVTTDSTGMVSLCSSCWVWRQLPPNYQPQYINELICDDSDTACLSGYASCSVGLRTMEVMRNNGTGSATVALTAGTYCECRVATGSALQSLVNGGGIAGGLAAPPSPMGRMANKE